MADVDINLDQLLALCCISIYNFWHRQSSDLYTISKRACANKLESIDCSCVQMFFFYTLVSWPFSRFLVSAFHLYVHHLIIFFCDKWLNSSKNNITKGFICCCMAVVQLVCHGFALRLILFHQFDNTNLSEFLFSFLGKKSKRIML